MTKEQEQNRYIKFDLMMRDRFIATIKIPTYMADGLDEGGEIHILRRDTLQIYCHEVPNTQKQTF